MLWMESYLFYYTVRLGVIIIGVFSFFQLLIPAILFMIYGMAIIEPIIKLFQNDVDYKYNDDLQRLIDWLHKEPQTAMAILLSYLFTHMATCLLLVFGAFKLNKWCLVPFAILELFRVIYLLAGHIVLMIMLKKLYHLGLLIAYTLVGGFIILYIAYNWAASVALYQIISLINSARYKRIYGEDPFRPIIRQTSGTDKRLPYGTVQNIRVLTTPHSGSDIDELKHQNALKPAAQVGIISVVPYNETDYSRQPLILESKRWTKPSSRLISPPKPQAVEPDYYKSDYGNWQWAELPGAYQQRQLNMRNNFISRY